MIEIERAGARGCGWITRGLAPLGLMGLMGCLVAGCPSSTTPGGNEEGTETGGTSTAPNDTGADVSPTEGTGSPAFACDDPFAAVTTLFEQRCATAGCHDATAAAGLVLVGDWPAAVLGQPASLCPGEIRVVPGDPEASHLYEKVAGPPSCGDRMPLVTDPLSPAEIDCIAAWIESAGPADCELCGGDTCIDTLSDASNCGGCGNVCPADVPCQSGACACPPGTEACGDACVDTLSDGDHCGGCNDPCGPGEFCLAGACGSDCAGLTACGASCVDTDSSEQHCGGCDQPCEAGSACSGGSCSCEGGPVSFAADVEPILVANCTSMGCHGFPMPQEGLDLRAGNGYADLVGVLSSQCGNRPLVDPGVTSNSYLLDKLNGVNLCFGTAMPKDPPPLTPDEIATISAWICAGAPDN